MIEDLLNIWSEIGIIKDSYLLWLDRSLLVRLFLVRLALELSFAFTVQQLPIRLIQVPNTSGLNSITRKFCY